MSEQEKWNARYAAATAAPPRAAAVLQENAHLLPATGRALDLACGRGGNALFLARRGFETEAWDISDVAISALGELAAAERLNLQAGVRDVSKVPPDSETFDIIVVSRFLDRSIVPAIANALRPGGVLFYQTFTREAVSKAGPSNPAYRLGPNELLRLFSGLRVLVYREEGRQGDIRQGFRDEAMLVAVRDGGFQFA